MQRGSIQRFACLQERLRRLQQRLANRIFAARWALLIWALLVTALLWNWNENFTVHCTDQAELRNTAERIRDGVLITEGPPSRYGARQPGPFQYYLVALVEGAAGTIGGQVVFIALHAGLILFCALALGQATGQRLAGALLAGGLLAGPVIYSLQYYVWPIPLGLVLLAGSLVPALRVAGGSLRAWPWLLLGLAATVQVYLAHAVPAAVLGVFAATGLALRLRGRMLRRNLLSRLLIGCIPAAALLLPAAAHILLTGGESVVALQTAHTGGELRSVIEVLQTAARSALFFAPDLRAPGADASGESLYAERIAAAALLAGASLCYASLWFPGRARPSRTARQRILRLAGAAGLAWLCSVLSLFLVRESILVHYTLHLQLFAWLFLAGGAIAFSVPLAALLKRFFPARFARTSLQTAAGLLVAGVVSAWVAPQILRNHRATSLQPDWNLCPYTEMQAVVDAIATQGTSVLPIVRGEHELVVSGAFAYDFRRQKAPLAPDAKLIALIQAPPAPEGCPQDFREDSDAASRRGRGSAPAYEGRKFRLCFIPRAD